MSALWRIELLGGLRAAQGERVITRFRTRKTGGLLAYLAFYRDRTSSRDALVDLLWTDDAVESGRHNLRLALSSLRHQFESSDALPGGVLITDRQNIRLNPAAVTTDVAEFETALALARFAKTDEERAEALRAAVTVYGGDLLPGYHESWIVPQQLRLEDEYVQAVVQLSEGLDRSGDAYQALEYVGRAASVYPLREELHLTLMRLYMASGQGNAARRQYERLTTLLQDAWGEKPSKAVQEYAATLTTPALPARRPDRPAPPRIPVPKPGRVAPEPAQAATTLALPISRFFGREEELGALEAWLAADPPTRLITLMGAGGCGKTRLSQELLGRLRNVLPDRLWFVPLAELENPALLPAAILKGMGLPLQPNRPPLDQVISAIGASQGLLILDNFEQLVEDGAPIVQTILERTTALSCLVTSRQRLNLVGEREFTVHPLAVPRIPPLPANAEDRTLAPGPLEEYPSIQLFVERARAVKPDFDLTRINARAVAELCQRLEGIPLAIELAAARAGVLTPAQMLGHLSTRLLPGQPGIFESRQRGTPARHRSLRATLDWSYGLLQPDQQRFFARLSVFRGGWTSDAAQAICCDIHEGEGMFALDLLADLQERSLIQPLETESGMRFTMLETMREYGDLALTEAERATYWRRHRVYFCEWAESVTEVLRAGDTVSFLKRFDQEAENLRAALDRPTASPDDAQYNLRIAATLWHWWSSRGYWTEGRERLSRYLEADSQSPPAPYRAEALVGAGTLARTQGDHKQARVHLEEASAVSRGIGDERNAAAALYQLGILAIERAEYDTARSLLDESIAIQRRRGDEVGRATSLIALGIAVRQQGDGVAAKTYVEESLAVRRARNDRRGIAVCLTNLGSIASEQGDHAAAYNYHIEAMNIHREMGDRRSITTVLICLAIEQKHLGNREQARAHYEESLAICRENGDRPNIAIALVNLGPLTFQMGDFEASRAYLTESLTLAHALGERRVFIFGVDAFAGLAHAESQFPRAVHLFAAATALRETIGLPRTTTAQADFEQRINALREALGDDAFTEAEAYGRTLTWESVMAYALGGS